MSTPVGPQDPSPARIIDGQAQPQRPSAIQKQLANNTEKQPAEYSPTLTRQPVQRRQIRPWLFLLSGLLLTALISLAVLRPSFILPEQLKDYIASIMPSGPGAASNTVSSSHLTTDQESIANNNEQADSSLISSQLELADVLTSQLQAQPALVGQLLELYENILLQQPELNQAKMGLAHLRELSLESLASHIDSEDYTKAQQLAAQLITYFPEISSNATFRVLQKQINSANATATLTKPDQPPIDLSNSSTLGSPSASPEQPAKNDEQNKQALQPARLPPSIDAVQASLADSTGQQGSPNSTDAQTLFVRFDYQGFTENTTVLNLELQSLGKASPIATVPIIVTGPRGTKTLQIHSAIDDFEEQRYQLDFILHSEKIGSYEFSL